MSFDYLVRITTGLAFVIILSACSEPPVFSVTDRDSETGRWYTASLLTQGESVYQNNCMTCHKAKARGIFNWKKTDQDGNYPPPPLNGSAHAWHHSLPVLLKTINDGGLPVGGKMPPFKNVLSNQEKMAVIAYFQSFWSDDIYQNWLGRNE